VVAGTDEHEDHFESGLSGGEKLRGPIYRSIKLSRVLPLPVQRTPNTLKRHLARVQRTTSMARGVPHMDDTGRQKIKSKGDLLTDGQSLSRPVSRKAWGIEEPFALSELLPAHFQFPINRRLG
jgi:hypothetical protein